MIAVTPQMRILVATEPIDFRSGIDGLSRICRSELQCDPFSGWVFVFCNRRKTAIKVLVYDGQGFWVCHKRLSEGRFRWWPQGDVSKTLAAHELQVLLWNGNPMGAHTAPLWKAVASSR